jgi:pentatricopeptide repeat protein
VTYRIPVNGLGNASKLDIALELFQEMENDAYFPGVHEYSTLGHG